MKVHVESGLIEAKLDNSQVFNSFEFRLPDLPAGAKEDSKNDKNGPGSAGNDHVLQNSKTGVGKQLSGCKFWKGDELGLNQPGCPKIQPRNYQQNLTRMAGKKEWGGTPGRVGAQGPARLRTRRLSRENHSQLS